MRLLSITLKNFRQFSGEQPFDLSSTRDKPVILIFGANGAGKTTLLNAFTWALYGEMSYDVEEQHRLVNDVLWHTTPMGGHVDLAVELCFEHQGVSYRLRRGAQVRKESDEQRRLDITPELWKTTPDGSSEVVGAPQQTIYSILPSGISRFFFFNGERIEKLVQKSSYMEVKQDIKGLLALEQVERAIAHLPRVSRKLSADVKTYGGEAASKLQDTIDLLTDQYTTGKIELAALDTALAELIDNRDRTAELLRQNESVSHLQKERDRVGAELEEARALLQKAITERAQLVATRGFQAFTTDIARDTVHMADALYQKGKLPAPLKRELVDKLLDEERCICGSPLTAGTPNRDEVLRWRELTGLAMVETAWQQLSIQASDLFAARKQLQDDLQEKLARITSERDRVNRLLEAKSDLDGQLANHRAEDVQKLESQRMDLDRRAEKKKEEIWKLRSSLETTQRNLEKARHDLSAAEVKDALALKARSRSDLVQSVQHALEEVLEIRRADMRTRLDGKLKHVYQGISYKAYTPELSSDFELTLYDSPNNGGLPVAKSAGENQILSLAFVTAVSELAREIRLQRQQEGGPMDDGTFPIVVDAAFGSLDQNYRELVSRALARMAPQLVVLVSKSQGLGQVMTELQPFVNHVGVIVSHTTNSSTKAEDIVLFGMAHPYIQPSAESNYAELRTIK